MKIWISAEGEINNVRLGHVTSPPTATLLVSALYFFSYISFSPLLPEILQCCRREAEYHHAVKLRPLTIFTFLLLLRLCIVYQHLHLFPSSSVAEKLKCCLGKATRLSHSMAFFCANLLSASHIFFFFFSTGRCFPFMYTSRPVFCVSPYLC